MIRSADTQNKKGMAVAVEDYGIAVEDTYGDVSTSDSDGDTVDFSHSRQSSYNRIINASSCSISSAKTHVATASAAVRDFLSPRSDGTSRSPPCNTENANSMFSSVTRKASLSSLRRTASASNGSLMADNMIPNKMLLSVTSPDSITTCLSPYFPPTVGAQPVTPTSTVKSGSSYFAFGKAGGDSVLMVPVVVNATKTPLDNECIRNKKSFTANAPYNEPSKDCHDETAAVCDQSDCRNSDGGNDDDTDDGDCDCSSSRESNSYSSNTLPPINQLYDYDSSSISENDDDNDDGDGSRSIDSIEGTKISSDVYANQEGDATPRHVFDITNLVPM
jgi:hypothetical protein